MAGHAWRRFGERRGDADWLSAMRASSEARVLAFVEVEPVVARAAGAEPRRTSLSAGPLCDAWGAALEWTLRGEFLTQPGDESRQRGLDRMLEMAACQG